MNSGVIQVRADICGDCKTPCLQRPDPALPCSSCPLNQWGQWGACDFSAVGADASAPAGVTAATPMRGLGDLIAVVAEPIARAVGLDKSKCGCAKRQHALNARFPFGN